jgi:hypothetical protein
MGAPETIRFGRLATFPSAQETTMNESIPRPVVLASVLAVALVLAPAMVFAHNSSARKAPSSAAQGSRPLSERWLHVRVEDQGSDEQNVRVNVPLELAEKILPTIDHDPLHNGRVRVGQIEGQGVDLRALLDAVRTSKDGEFVTVQDKETDARVAKQDNYLVIHVTDNKHAGKKSQVDVRVPIKVVDALFSGPRDEIDLVAGLQALSAMDDTELVSVTDKENRVRVWLDSKSSSD